MAERPPDASNARPRRAPAAGLSRRAQPTRSAPSQCCDFMYTRHSGIGAPSDAAVQDPGLSSGGEDAKPPPRLVGRFEALQSYVPPLLLPTGREGTGPRAEVGLKGVKRLL